jgi:hypothetical protein
MGHLIRTCLDTIALRRVGGRDSTGFRSGFWHDADFCLAVLVVRCPGQCAMHRVKGDKA